MDIDISVIYHQKLLVKMQEGIPSSSLSCKNHPSQPSGYFVSDQPWVKYCRDCALNVALSGRKIQKELNAQEFDRKMQLSAVVAQLRGSLTAIDQTAEHYRRLTDILEEVAAPLAASLKEVDAGVKQLLQAKERLERLYAKQVEEKVHAYYQKQSKMAMLSLQIKRELEIIQSTFGTLIEMGEDEGFQQQKQTWQKLIEEHQKESLSQQLYNDSRGRIITSIEDFYNQLQGITRFTIEVRLDRSKTNPTLNDFDITLTPIDGNSLADTVTFQHLNLNLKTRGPLKLRTNKKLSTERDSLNGSKTFTKRKSVCGGEFQTMRR